MKAPETETARSPSRSPLPLGEGEKRTDHPLTRCHPEAPPWRGRRIPSHLERFDLNPSIWTKGTFGSPHAVPCRHPASRSGRPPSGPAPRYPGACPLPSRPPRSPGTVPPPQTRMRARSPSLPRTPSSSPHAVVIPARSRHPRTQSSSPRKRGSSGAVSLLPSDHSGTLDSRRSLPRTLIRGGNDAIGRDGTSLSRGTPNSSTSALFVPSPRARRSG